MLRSVVTRPTCTESPGRASNGLRLRSLPAVAFLIRLQTTIFREIVVSVRPFISVGRRPGWSIDVSDPSYSDPVPGTRRLKGLASKQYRVCVRFTKIKRRSDTVGIPGEP